MTTDDLLTKLPIREHGRNILKIIKYVRGLDRWYFPAVAVSLLLKTAVPYAELMLTAYILDGIGAHREIGEMLAVITGTTLAVMLLQFLSGAIWHRMEVHREQMYYLYECETQTKMLDMDFSRIDSPKVKELKDRIRKDNNWGAGINGVLWSCNGVMEKVFQLIGAALVGFPAAVILLRTKTAAVWILLAALTAVQVVSVFLRMHFGRQRDRWRYHVAESTGEKEETYSFAWDFAAQESYHYKNGKDIRIYGGYDLMARWTTEVLRHKGFRSPMIKASQNDAGEAFFGAAAGAAANGGAYLIIVMIALAGMVTVGNVVRLAGAFGRFLEAAAGVVHDVPVLAMAARQQLSTLALIHMENEMYQGSLPVEKRSDGVYRIAFRNVTFRYPGAEKDALKNFSVELSVGEKLAIVGMNGSGKTTMIKLLCRLYDPQEGEILLNGVDIRKFKQEEYSRLFSVVFQDFTLYPFPLAQNIAVSQDYDRELAGKCLEDAGFGARLASMEKGLETCLYKDYDDEGVEISGGEAQKIAIARAVYKDAPFIVLDEPTAALDPLAEYGIYSNFDKIVGRKTAVYISHRLSSCRFCEKIAVFHEGELVQLGSHEELAADKNGKYYELWHAQAQYYEEEDRQGRKQASPVTS